MDADEALASKLREELYAEAAFVPPASEKKQNTSNNNDEEFAQKLQMELDNTPTNKAFDADILFAQSLQAQYDKEEKEASKPPPYVPPPVQHPRMELPRASAPPTPGCIKRIRSDLEAIIRHPNPYIHVAPHDDDITHIEALIIGPEDTPYAGGFFHFDMRFPHDYPWNPPKVILRTTDSGRTRFNPNLYADGKVCLSILGTWQGPGWKAVQTIETVLVSVQSLMNAKPYHNEPGFEQERRPSDVKNYNECILHETLRVAVIGMMEKPTCGDVFRPVMDAFFLQQYEKYEKIAHERVSLENKPMKDPFGALRGNYQYGVLLSRLAAVKNNLVNPSAATTTTTTTTTSPGS